MADSFIQVAPDSTGKMLRAVSGTVGANTVYEQVVIPMSPRTRTGYYRADSGLLSMLAAAQTSPAGLLWFFNPTTSTVAVAIKTVSLQYGSAAAAAAATRILAERFTSTTAPTGAALTPARRVRTAVAGLTADAAPQATIRTANTGLTVANVEALRSWLIPTVMTAAGMYGGQFMWDPGTEDDELILAPGEGVQFRQADAGVTSDPRRVTITHLWEEFTAP